MLIGLWIAGALAVFVHLSATAMAWALRVYSRSQLESACVLLGHPGRPVEVAAGEERALQAFEIIATASAAVLAVIGALLLGLGAQPDRLRSALVLGTALLAFLLLRMLSGALARVHAERLLARLWPLSVPARLAATPFGNAARTVEALEKRRVRRHGQLVPQRPSSVEVELTGIPGENGDSSGEIELPPATRRLFERAAELGQHDVSEVMTPRSAMFCLPAGSSALDAARAVRETGFSRIPLYGAHHDDIVGILHAKDLFRAFLDGEPADQVEVNTLARPAFLVPETRGVDRLLEDLRDRQVQMAIVFDEYGGVSGLVTLEDLLEQLVGEIHDEHDEPEPEASLERLDEAVYLADASMPLDELNTRLGLQLPAGDDYSTLAGMVFHTLGTLPLPGTRFEREGVQFTVVELDGRSISRVRIDLPRSAAPAAEPGQASD